MTNRPDKTFPAPRGFTLIELLVVMVILAIIIALAVAIGGYINEESSRKRTQTAQEILKTAVDVYEKAYDGRAPGDDWDSSWSVTKPGDEAEASTVALLQRLKEVPQSWKVVEKLEEEIFEDAQTPLIDGFGYPMKYVDSGGRGKTPVLISTGPDGEFDTEDDIRSDKQ